MLNYIIIYIYFTNFKYSGRFLKPLNKIKIKRGEHFTLKIKNHNSKERNILIQGPIAAFAWCDLRKIRENLSQDM